MKGLRLKDFNKDLLKIDQIDLSRRSSTFSTSTLNSFLIEIDNNSDIDDRIRTEINTRFKKSLVNAKYIFPRAPEHPFPAISLKQKFPKKENNKATLKTSIRPFKLTSHTPKPSLNRSIQLSNKLRQSRATPELDLRLISITPTPLALRKPKNHKALPKPHHKSIRSHTPYIPKPYHLLS